jgi:multiple sugar transport system ATP-binding protein
VTTVYVTHDQTEAMTLGDRVAVLRKGKVQQVASPRDLYRDPVNLFVAGFIGSPAMNFLPGEVEGRHVTTPLAEFDLHDDVASRYDGGDRKVIVGVRPENFEDDSLIRDDIRDQGVTFSAQVDQVEWLGADVYAYFQIGGSSGDDVARLADDLDTVEVARGDQQRVAARVDRSSEVRPRAQAELWLDTRAIHLFDAETGDTLTRRTEDVDRDRQIDLREQEAARRDPSSVVSADQGAR